MMMIFMQKIEVAIKHEANMDHKHYFSALLWNRFEFFFLIVGACCLSFSRKIMTILNDYH